MISIIVPVYNSQKQLSKCIDSILSQSYHDFEMLLINDGSTDESGIICEKYARMDMKYSLKHYLMPVSLISLCQHLKQLD